MTATFGRRIYRYGRMWRPGDPDMPAEIPGTSAIVAQLKAAWPRKP